MIDLEPATRVLSALVEGVRDEQLDGRTPCEGTTVGDLVDHVNGLSLAFTYAAEKTPLDGGSQPPSADGSRLGAQWRTRIPVQLAAMAAAWQQPTAWEGMTEAGGVQMPAEVMGLVALDEVVVHAWDLAVSSGQTFSCDPDLLDAVHGFVRATAAENPQGSSGLFGPAVAVAEDAPLIDRVIGLTGRDPAWSSARPRTA